MNTSTRRASHVLVVAMAVFMALTLGAGSVMATEISHTGKIGDHQLNDGPSNAGMICIYESEDNGNSLKGFEEVMPPTIWSRDKTSGRDRQRVGWRYTIQRKRNNGAWKKFYKSSIVKAYAWDDQSAFFLKRTPLNIMIPLDISPDHSSYRVRITQYWYKADGSVAGTALSQVDTYFEDNGTSQTEFAYCPSTFQV